jgi:hypothetical protein
MIGANTIFATKELLLTVPFRGELQRHEDLDWLPRASTLGGVGVQFVPTHEPLVIWHREETHNSISRRTDWRYSLAWINNIKHLVTPKAHASFLLTWLSANAVREGDWKAFFAAFTRCVPIRQTELPRCGAVFWNLADTSTDSEQDSN